MDAVYMTGGEAGIMTDDRFGDAAPLMEVTKFQVREKLSPLLAEGKMPVVTGYIGATQSGDTTTFGRGGSDLTATIIASAIGADEVWIWSDVDGLMTADPRMVPNAQRPPRGLLRGGRRDGGLRREGAPPAHPGAGRGEGDPREVQEHVQARRTRARW